MQPGGKTRYSPTSPAEAYAGSIMFMQGSSRHRISGSPAVSLFEVYLLCPNVQFDIRNSVPNSVCYAPYFLLKGMNHPFLYLQSLPLFKMCLYGQLQLTSLQENAQDVDLKQNFLRRKGSVDVADQEV